MKKNDDVFGLGLNNVNLRETLFLLCLKSLLVGQSLTCIFHFHKTNICSGKMKNAVNENVPEKKLFSVWLVFSLIFPKVVNQFFSAS